MRFSALCAMCVFLEFPKLFSRVDVGYPARRAPSMEYALVAFPSHPERIVRRAALVATGATVCVAAAVLLLGQPRVVDTWQPNGDTLGYLLAGPPAVWQAAPVPGFDLQRSVIPDDPPGWHLDRYLRSGSDGPGTFQLVLTLLKMILITRSSVAGSIEEKNVRDAAPTVAGWTRAKGHSGRHELNALIFTQPETSRAVLVLKETDNGVFDANKSLFESCANSLVFALTPEARRTGPPWAPPGACESWSEEQRDFPRQVLPHAPLHASRAHTPSKPHAVLASPHAPQALRYASDFLRESPQFDLLLIGHSSGGAFAMIAASLLEARGINASAAVFANCPWKTALRERYGLQPTRSGRRFFLPDRFDPVAAYAAATDGWPGTYCVWDGTPADAVCSRCFADFPRRITTRCTGHDDYTPDPCQACFMEHHTTENYWTQLPLSLSPERPAAGLHCVSGDAMDARQYPGVAPPKEADAHVRAATSIVEMQKRNAEAVREEIEGITGVCASWAPDQTRCERVGCSWSILYGLCMFPSFLSSGYH